MHTSLAPALDLGHGSLHRYVVEGCRCHRCTEAKRVQLARTARIAAGFGDATYVAAAPVRLHLRALSAYGIDEQTAGRIAGVPRDAMARLLHWYDGRPPVGRMQAEAAAALLALLPPPGSRARLLDGIGVRRRLRALIASGFTRRELGRRLGLGREKIAMLLWSECLIDAGTAAKVAALYDELRDLDPVCHGVRANVATYMRNLADARGWYPPEAWPGTSIDDPAATAYLAPCTANETAGEL